MTMKTGDFIHSELPCKLCKETQARVISTEGRHGQSLTTVICIGCGLIHSHPIPTKVELDEYYRTHYRNDYKDTYTPKRKHILRYSRNAIERLERLKPFIASGKLLDVGSGSGEFVYIAKRAGFDASGLEPHEGYSDYTRKMFDVNIITAPLEKAAIAREQYDVITLHHVLEHLQYPLTSLSLLNEWLKPDGILMVDVPNIEESRHSPDSRFHYAHIYNFNHRTLSAFLEKAGFSVIRHPQNQATILAAKKVEAPDRERVIAMPENYTHLWSILTAEGSQELHRKGKPLLRLLRKCYLYPKEIIASCLYPDARSIAEHVFRKWQQKNALQTT